MRKEYLYVRRAANKCIVIFVFMKMKINKVDTERQISKTGYIMLVDLKFATKFLLIRKKFYYLIFFCKELGTMPIQLLEYR